MSLLTVVQDAMTRMNLPVPAAAYGNVDTTVQQIVSFAQDIGDELSERFFWRALNTLGTVTGDGTTTVWPLPADFGQLSPGFNLVSSSRPTLYIRGPITNEDLNRLKSYAAGPALCTWRLIGQNIELWPALAAGEVVTFSYYASLWIQPATPSSGVVPARIARYQADTDTCVIDERILTSGVIWRWLASKGLDYAEEFRRYEARLDRSAGRENTDRVVSMSDRAVDDGTWWPGTITDLTAH